MNVYRCRLRRPFLLVFGRLGDDDLAPSPSSELVKDSNTVIGVSSLFVFVCVGAGNPVHNVFDETPCLNMTKCEMQERIRKAR